MPTIRDYCDEAILSVSELARRANIDYKTVKKAYEGEPIKRVKAVSILRALSVALGRQITLGDVEDLKIK